MKGISFPILAGGLCGFISAGIIGWSLAGDSSTPSGSVAGPEAVVGKNERSTRPSRLSPAAAAAAKRLAVVRGASTREDRMRATVDLANSLPVADFAAWMEGGYFNLRGGPELTLFSKILMERWKQEDPEGLIAWSIKNDNYQGRQILAEWSKNEPRRALDYFKRYPDEPQEMSLLRNIAASHPDLALRRFQEIAGAGISRNAMSYADGLMEVFAEKSPAALEAVLASFPPGLLLRAEMALSGQRLKTSFSTEIRSLWELPDGWKIFERNAQRNQEMAAGIFNELADLPAAWKSSVVSDSHYLINETTAQKWLDADLAGYGFTPDQIKSLKTNALNVMDRNKPEEIFRRMAEMDLDDDTRRSVISNAFGYESKTPAEMEAFVALLSTEADRDIARSLAKERVRHDDDSKPEKPEEWLEKIGELSPSASAYSLMNTIQNWDPEKMSQLESQFGNMPDDKKRVVAQVITNNSSSTHRDSRLRGQAIRYLVSQPVEVMENQRNPGREIISASSGYAVHLAQDDPEAAAEWVRSLPAGDARSWAEKNLATNWAQYDPKAVAQWLKTLPTASREEVTNYMNKK